MDEYTLVAILFFIVIGIAKGSLLGSAIIKKFPKRKKAALITSLSLTVLFLISAIMSLNKIMNLKEDEKISTFTVQSFNDLLAIDYYALLSAFIIPVIIFLLARGKIKKKHTKFLRITMGLYYGLYLMFAFTNLIPGEIAISLLIVYQLAIVFGVVIGTGLLEKI